MKVFLLVILLFFSCGLLKKTAKRTNIQKEKAVEIKQVTTQKTEKKIDKQTTKKVDKITTTTGGTTKTTLYFQQPVTLEEIENKTAPVAKVETKTTTFNTKTAAKKTLENKLKTHKTDTLTQTADTKIQDKEAIEVIEKTYAKRAAGWSIGLPITLAFILLFIYLYKKYKRFLL